MIVEILLTCLNLAILVALARDNRRFVRGSRERMAEMKLMLARHDRRERFGGSDAHETPNPYRTNARPFAALCPKCGAPGSGDIIEPADVFR